MDIIYGRKILIVCGALDYGGAGKIIKFVANYLVKRGWNISVYSLRQKERSKALDKKINHIGKDGLVDKRFKFLHWRLDELYQIRVVAKKEKPDIICAFVSDCVFMTRLATLGLRKFKFVSAERGDPYTLPQKWVKPVAWAYKHSDYCIFQLSKQGRFFGTDVMKRSFVIPNPYIPLCETTSFKGERNKTIVGAGRFDHQKGFDVLIKAFAKVYAKHSDYRLILFGSGPLLDEYKLLSDELSISQVVEYPGYVDNIAEAIKYEGIFVLPSRFEGIPNALIEALSTGIPTVSADCTPGGPDFLTDHGRRGVLVAVEDVDGTANAIINLIENPIQASKIGEKGREIIKDLEPSIIAAQWESAFNKMLNNS